MSQIDLVFLRADNIATVCEAKHTGRVAADTVDEFDKRLRAFTEHWRHGVQKALILADRAEAADRIKAYFDEIVYVEGLFGA